MKELAFQSKSLLKLGLSKSWNMAAINEQNTGCNDKINFNLLLPVKPATYQLYDGPPKYSHATHNNNNKKHQSKEFLASHTN
jgi:hypothetical protein